MAEVSKRRVLEHVEKSVRTDYSRPTTPETRKQRVMEHIKQTRNM